MSTRTCFGSRLPRAVWPRQRPRELDFDRLGLVSLPDRWVACQVAIKQAPNALSSLWGPVLLLIPWLFCIWSLFLFFFIFDFCFNPPFWKFLLDNIITKMSSYNGIIVSAKPFNLYISRLQAPWLMADAHELSGTRWPTNPSSTCSNGTRFWETAHV